MPEITSTMGVFFPNNFVSLNFTIAAPGLPAGMGTALWASTLFTAMLGIDEPARSSLITTWVALYGGVPDMFITAGNCTGDGFTAVIFDRFFHKFLKNDE